MLTVNEKKSVKDTWFNGSHNLTGIFDQFTVY